MAARPEANIALTRHGRSSPIVADDDGAFDAFAAGLLRRLALVAAPVMLVCTLAWWPLDRYLLPADHVDAFAALRTRTSLVVLVGFALVMLVPPGRRSTIAAAGASYAAMMAVIGYSLGVTGPSGVAWFADACLGVVPLALAPVRLEHRVPMTAAAGGALALGFVGSFPGPLAGTPVPAQLSFLVFAMLISIATGEMAYRVTRRSFFERRALDTVNARLAELTDTLSDQVAERTRTLRDLARHLDHVQEAERRRIGHDLHDDLGQQLTAMRYAVARLEDLLARAPDIGAGTLIDDLNALLDGTTRSVRQVVSRLRPRILDDLGLLPALEWLCEDVSGRGDTTCSLVVTDAFRGREVTLPDASDAVLFRVAQEATTNVARHARAAHVTVELDADDDAVRVSVADDGIGFDPGVRASGFGLLGLRERLADLGGWLQVSSAPGEGTRLVAEVPTSPAEVPSGPAQPRGGA